MTYSLFEFAKETAEDLVVVPDTLSTAEEVISVRTIHRQVYQPMTHICIMSSHKPLRIYMEGLILGVNILYRLFYINPIHPIVFKSAHRLP